MDQYASSPGHSTYSYAELAASFINFLHYCLPTSGFYGAGKDNRGRCTDNPCGLRLPDPPYFTDPTFQPVSRLLEGSRWGDKTSHISLG